MKLSIKSIAPHVLREYLLPFVANDDVLAIRMSNQHLKTSCGDVQFVYDSLVDQHPLVWWSWMLDQIRQVKHGAYLPNYGYMIARSATPQLVHKFFRSKLFKRLLKLFGEDFQGATALMCEGAAASGSVEKCQAIRGYVYNDWNAGANRAAVTGHVQVLEWLEMVGELGGFRNHVPGTVGSPAIDLGLRIGAYGSAATIDWALSDLNEDEDVLPRDVVSYEAVGIGAVANSNWQGLLYAAERYSDFLPICGEVIAMASVAYKQTHILAWLVHEGVQPTEKIIDVYKKEHGGYVGHEVCVKMGCKPTFVGRDILEWWKSRGYPIGSKLPERLARIENGTDTPDDRWWLW